jgi:hypothetical protein
MELREKSMPKPGKLGAGKEHVKTAASKYEKKLAKELGGTPVVGSGAFDAHKADVKTKTFLFESKQSGKKSIVLSSTVLSKITREAREENKFPAVIATLEDMPFGVSKAWCVVPLSVFNSLLDELERCKGT